MRGRMTSIIHSPPTRTKNMSGKKKERESKEKKKQEARERYKARVHSRKKGHKEKIK